MPTPLTSNAVVLRTTPFSDTSLIVRLFTEDFGKVSVIAKGARRPKQAAVSILQPPNHVAVWYSFKEGRDIQTLTKSEFVERYTGLSTQLAKGAAAMLIVEMLDRAVHDSDPHPILFRLITSTLRQVDQTEGDVTVLMNFYQLHLAKQLGFGAQLSSCGRCGRPMKEALFEPNTGTLLCPRCRSAEGIRLGRNALDYLQRLAATHISELSALELDRNTNKEVGNFLLNHLYYHVDGMTNLKSIKFWKQVSTT
ncbi:MAG: DNA repair protein RecO [Fidelibacterota bacterium]|nr:MAG: DNA repair protein RecO [Candidatus Neomarinimicrobiota bacterium]